MDGKIDTVREALETAIVWLSRRGGEDDMPLPIKDQPQEVQRLHKALSALDSLAATPSEDARDLAADIQDRTTHDGGDIMRLSLTEAAALIQARDERIRRECAEKAKKAYLRHEGVDGIISAILTPEATDGQ